MENKKLNLEELDEVVGGATLEIMENGTHIIRSSKVKNVTYHLGL